MVTENLLSRVIRIGPVANTIVPLLQMVCCPELRPFTLHGKETAWPDSLVMLVGCERIAKEEAGLGAGPGRQS